jgi:predicted ferric reductase
VSLLVRGTLFIGLYLSVTVAPLLFAAIGASQPGQGFWTDFSVALGFVGLAMMGLEIMLVARFQAIAAPFGQDALLQFHRQIGYAGLAFVLVHVALSADWAMVADLDSGATPLQVRFGVLAVVALLVLVGTSVWRRRLRLSYEVWQGMHGALAITAIVTALIHVLLVDYYVDAFWKKVLWSVMSGAFVGLLLWVRALKPLQLRRRPWTIERVVPERANTTTLVLRPDGHPGLHFAPGQFAWFSIGRSPFSLTHHPFSFASSSEDADGVSISVKALGDFTATFSQLRPGTRVYVDGPHGVFSIDRDEGPGFAFIAGGVGITGVLSMLRTMADRADVRPAVLFYANRDAESVAFLDELDELAGRLRLRIVHVLERAPEDFDGETGYVTADVLRRHLPSRGYRRTQYFICGPEPMMDAVEAALTGLGVPTERIHTERFSFV